MLVTSEILRQFVNTLTFDDKYFTGNTENLRQTIQIKLYKKLNIFSKFLTASLKSAFDFKLFEKKDESRTLCLSEIIDCEKRADINVLRVTFQ